MAAQFALAPPSKLIDGLLAVPISIQSLTASAIFDASAQIATVAAEMRFVIGPDSGCGMFDLRQPIRRAWLDGSPIGAELLASRDLGGGPGAEMRVLGVPLPAGSEHLLRFEYEVGRPLSPESRGIVWHPESGRVLWDVFMSDLWPGRYLEQWFPANFIFDQFPFRLDLRVVNTPLAHRPITNGTVIPITANHWTIEFPDRYTALSHLIVLAPVESLDTLHSQVGNIQVETSQLWSSGLALAEEQARIHRFLALYGQLAGPYIHGERFTAFLWTNSRSMEYDGAVCSNPAALEHEVFHSWFARGVKPASQNDGWIDEAFTMWTTEANRLEAAPFDMSRPPVLLCSANPYNRATPMLSYREGFRFFAGLAAVAGVEPLLDSMLSLYRENPLRLLTTAELESRLAPLGNLTAYFRRFVYGFD